MDRGVMKKVWVAVLVCCACGAVAGCGGGNSPGPESSQGQGLQPELQPTSGATAKRAAVSSLEYEVELGVQREEADADAEMQQERTGAKAENVPQARAACEGDICTVELYEHTFVYVTAEYEVTSSSAATSAKLLNYSCGRYGTVFCMRLEAFEATGENRETESDERSQSSIEDQELAEQIERERGGETENEYFENHGGDGP
jgi:hypothetical protein